MKDVIDTKGWSDTDKKALEAMQAELAAEQGKLSDLETKEAAYKASPGYKLEQLRAEKERVQREREAREREALGLAELAKARTKYGHDKVELIPTLRAPIVMRTPTQKELDDVTLRVDGTASEQDKERLWRSFTADLIEFPGREQFMKICEEFPGTWGILREVRLAISHAVRAETAKKG